MRRWWSRAGVIILLLAMATAVVVAAEPDAAALVRQVREQEAWIERVESIRIQAVENWERTPKGLEQLRRRLAPQLTQEQLERHHDLRHHCKWIIELAYDRKRFRFQDQDEGYSDDLQVYDGRRFFWQNRYNYADWPDLATDQDRTMIGSDPEKWHGWSYFPSFRAGPHVFWWNSPQQRTDIERMAPRPGDFAYEGRADFHGFPCHVVSHWDSWTSLFIGVHDGRLHGMRSGALTSRKRKRALAEVLREAGHQVADEQDPERQWTSIAASEQARMRRLGAARLTQLIDPFIEHRLALHKEVAPGCRMPMVQSVHFFSEQQNGDAFETESGEMRILKVKVNEPLPDALFTVTFKEGERIIDQTTEPPLSYRYKPKMTADEWSTILEEAKKKAKAKRDREAQKKRVGQ